MTTRVGSGFEGTEFMENTRRSSNGDKGSLSSKGHHSFRPNLSGHLSIRPSLSLAISHSGHQSLFSESRENTLSGRSNRRQKTFTSGNFSGELSGELSGNGFFLHRKEHLEEISNLSQSTGTRNPSTRRPRAFFRPATASHAPAREGAPARASFGVLLLPWALRSVFPASSGYFFSTPIPARALGSVLLPFRSMTKYGMASSQVYSVTSPESWGRSEIPNLGGNDSSPILITGHKLNGHNYLQWSQSVLLFICGKGKDEYLTGEAAMPETTEPGFRKWKIENSMIMSWLINSMNNDIGENFLCLGLQRTYGMQPKKLTQVLKIFQNFFRLNQPYMTSAKESSQLLSIRTHSQATYRQIVEQKRLFKFFLGLNRELDDVRGRIMGIKPLPSLREAFSEVRREESRKKVMMGSKEQPAPTLDGSALAARSFNSSGGDRQKRIGLGVIIPRSDRDGKAHVAANSESTSVPEPSPFNKEQMEMLQKLLSQVGSGSTTGIALTASRGGMKPWIVDTGASDHMTGDAAILQNYKPSNGHSSVHIADGSKSKIAGTGSIKLTKDLYLDSVLHVPNLDCNLLSISKLARDLQCVTKFYPNSCVFQDLKSGKMIGSAELCSELYLLSCGQFSNQVSQASCVQSQIHSDVWGPSRIKNISGTRWFVTFVDDHTRVTWVFLMKEKSEVRHIFQTFNLMVQNQFNSKIQVLKSDNAKEYFTSSLSTYLQNHGIIHISSCVDTPQQNGVAERKNRHLLEVARCLMFSSNVPNYFWGEAILTATYLINRMPSRVLTFQSPRQLFLKQFPHTRAASSDLPLKVFGCTTFVHVYPQNHSKFAPRANKCIFLGYSPTQKGYKCYSPTNKRFYTTMDVSFFEHVFFYPKFHVQGESMNEHQVWESHLEVYLLFTQSHQILPNSCPLSCPHPCRHQSSQPSTQMFLLPRRKRQELEHGSQSTCGQYIDSNSSLPEENIGEDRAGEVLIPSIDDSTLPIALRKGVRRCTDHPIGNYVTYEGLSPSYRAFATSLDDTQVPNTIQEALKISEWKKAVQDEIDALEKNGTWTITDLPVGKRPVGCKWIFTIKYKADGSVERFKARLVARGFTQSYGIDYQETFAPVAKLNTIRILLSLAVNQDWCLQQLDIKNAFLNGDLEEEVYMEIPPGFEESMAKNQVCKLQKSLYGLKQSPRAWFDRFTKAVLKLGYKQGQADHTLFVKKSHAGKMAILIVYVDDIILSGNDMEELQNLKKYLSEEFEVKDLGNLKYFLGMEVARSRKGIVVSQRKYILDLLKETGMLGCKPIDTPMDSQKKLGIEKESTPVDRGRYQRLVGRLIYLSHTQPDIGFAVSAVSQFMHSPTEEHMEAVYRILRYLKMTPGKGLFFRKTENRDTKVYSDADWAGNIIDRRSTSGYCSFVWGNLVTGGAAISIAKNPVHHDRTKHVEIDRHFITEKVTSETVKLNYVPTKHQTADILTKALPRPNFEDLTCKLGLYDIYSPA
ncbi:Retrovirus-related Pol polyprotein from transposon TNT 1-94 [Vitis vinifera]|uniref:Retrovirus-related Pol polyprotein from transposon TNT 1-94 n=1 Tax=Vitis vinifera TaxID=29760 RepID=A0A438HFP1_VITVI|nr:Retrovirus-related Pol polyprotein from transposon TNT 1-94 [Vitis vinifera]